MCARAGISGKYLCAVITIIYFYGNCNAGESALKVFEATSTRAVLFAPAQYVQNQTNKLVSRKSGSGVVTSNERNYAEHREGSATDLVTSSPPDKNFVSKSLKFPKYETEIAASTEPMRETISADKEIGSHENLTLTQYITENVTHAGNDTYTLQQSEYSHLSLKQTAGFVAIGILMLAATGYLGFVIWRRHLVNKYGSSQILVTEDVYDISDLRHFDI